MTESIGNLAKVSTNHDQRIIIIEAISTNNVNTLQSHTTMLNVIMQHFPGKGQ